VKWGVTRRVLMAWVVTIPASAIVAALSFWALWAMHGATLR
jgi:PiT family inorganic phosphate transporter